VSTILTLNEPVLNEPVLKFRPQDFLVVESAIIPAPPPPQNAGYQIADYLDADFDYLRLRKSGYTTFEAIELIAKSLSLHRLDVGYAGLKDEDGITEQIISVPHGSLDRGAGVGGTGASGVTFIEPVREEHPAEHFISLQYHGCGTEAIRVGHLNGNSFRIVVRNLDEATATGLQARGTLSHLFANYYDTQRFGVPGGPRLTHLIGRAVIAERWAEARNLLRASGAPESQQAADFAGTASELFAALDPRLVSFYRSAAASADWNDVLAARLTACCAGDVSENVSAGLTYAFAPAQEHLAVLMRQWPELPYIKHRWDGQEMAESYSVRTTVIQTVIRAEDAAPDGHFGNGWRVTLNFFLPSGCYATTAIRQLFARKD
jgi:tRNA pseudouridine13 synthase